jgi:peptidoglycan glycosyltransferase
MTKELRRLSIVMLFMFIALFVSVSWIQVVEADSLAQNPHNKRTQLESYEIQRGAIIVDGISIASSVPSDDTYKFQRVYSDAAMWAPVTGYFNPALGSSTGIEHAMNADLSDARR